MALFKAPSPPLCPRLSMADCTRIPAHDQADRHRPSSPTKSPPDSCRRSGSSPLLGQRDEADEAEQLVAVVGALVLLHRRGGDGGARAQGDLPAPSVGFRLAGKYEDLVLPVV